MTGTNVLVVLADQFRADCLGVAGHPDVETPVLDGLAGDGTYFPESFCTAPLCTPSRYSLLTGLPPHRHGVHGNNQTLAAGLPTLPELARPAGVRSTAVGKMHLTPTYLDVGFETMLLAEQNGDGPLVDDYHGDLVAAGLVDGNDLIDQRQEYRSRANQRYWTSYGAAPSDLPKEWHSTTWIADRAIGELDERWTAGGQLMYLSFVKPHHPFDPPRPWDERYDPARLTILPGWMPDVSDFDLPHGYFDNAALTEDSLRQAMAFYYATITHLDFHLGRVLARLRELRAYDNTLIVFTSDHGEYLGFHHMLLKSGPMYEPLVRVPLIVKQPGRGGAAGIVDRRLTSGIDVVPTALAALGLAAGDLPGHDLGDPAWDRPAVVAEPESEGLMVRTGRHKVLERPGRRPVLFDLEADPLELDPREFEPIARSETRPAAYPNDDRRARFDAILDRGEHPWLR